MEDGRDVETLYALLVGADHIDVVEGQRRETAEPVKIRKAIHETESRTRALSKLLVIKIIKFITQWSDFE